MKHHKIWLSDVKVKGRLIKNAEETQINDKPPTEIKEKSKKKKHDAHETESVIKRRE